MPEIRFKLTQELETVLQQEQAARKQTLRRSVSFASLVQEYLLKGLLTEGKRVGPDSKQTSDSEGNGGISTFATLEVQARQIVKDRLELIELGSKVHAIMDENSKLRAENLAQQRALDKARKKIKQLTKESEATPETERFSFLGLTTKELLLVGIPTALFLFEKYSNGKAEEAAEQLKFFKQNMAQLPEAQRKEALQLLSHASIPWPKDLKAEVFQALGAGQ